MGGYQGEWLGVNPFSLWRLTEGFYDTALNEASDA